MNSIRAPKLVFAVITSIAMTAPAWSNASNLPKQALTTTVSINMSVCGVDTASPPYFHFASKKGPTHESQSGITYDLMEEVSLRLNINIEILRFPWKRCLSMLKKGTTDGVVGASFINERMLFGHYPMTPEGVIDKKRLMFSSIYWLYTNSPLILWDGKSLTLPDDGIVAANLGYSSVAILQKKGIEVHEEYLPSRFATMLMSNRTVLIAGYENQLEPLIASNIKNENISADLIKRLPIPLSHDDMYLLVSKPFYKSNKDMAENIWDLFREFHESGRYDEIVEELFDK